MSIFDRFKGSKPDNFEKRKIPKYKILIPAEKFTEVQLDETTIRIGDECFLTSIFSSRGLARCQLLESNPQPIGDHEFEFSVKLKVLEVLEPGKLISEGAAGSEISLNKTVDFSTLSLIRRMEQSGQDTSQWAKPTSPWVLLRRENVQKIE